MAVKLEGEGVKALIERQIKYNLYTNAANFARFVLVTDSMVVVSF